QTSMPTPFVGSSEAQGSGRLFSFFYGTVHTAAYIVFDRVAGLDAAQWVNYPPPGTPLTRDGKPNLAAPAPRTSDGKPDLSGVWFHERTSVAEMKRLYGAIIDEQIKVGVPGMEIGTQHKYSFNILID